MNAIRAIRSRLVASQSELADALEVSQGNVSFYEKGQPIPPNKAARLIEFAKTKGLEIGYDHVYGVAELPPLQPEQAAESAPQSAAQGV